MYMLKLHMKMMPLKCPYISKLHICQITEVYIYLWKLLSEKDTKLPSYGVYDEGDWTVSLSIKFNVQTTKFTHNMWMQLHGG
jgi:hypothetical protein